MMKKTLALACLLATPSFTPSFAMDAQHPVVVELFQSQGCSSCPPANARVLAIADRPDVLALSWEVTYWDYLGWKDTFGDRAFTQRQYDYARTLGHDGVFTPQVVINGRVDGVGSGPGELQQLIAQGDRGNSGPALTVTDSQAQIGAGRGRGEVVMVRYDPNLVQVPVHRGENAGETLPHRNVVHQVVVLGTWDGSARSFALPEAPRAGLKTAILVHEGHTGPILAAAHT
jgi:hypothetical protein